MRQPLGMAVTKPEAGPQPRWHRAGTRPWGVGGGSCMSAGNAHRTPPRLSQSGSGALWEQRGDRPGGLPREGASQLVCEEKRDARSGRCGQRAA